MSGARTISRRKLAAFIADRLKSGDGKEALQQAAAYLVENGQRRNVSLLVRDVEEALARQGVVVADITAAHPITKDATAIIEKMLDAKELHVRETVDPAVLGGVRVDASGRRYDATLRRKIDLLKTVNAKKGVK